MNTFHSKILLFGEYTVIHKSQALAVPFHHFSGELGFVIDHLALDIEKVLQSNQSLKLFYHYIKKRIKNAGNHLAERFNLLEFKNDIKNGLFFYSDIPIGYGIGSSGALTAAIYHRYVRDRSDFMDNSDNQKVFELKSDLAQLEAFFHGISSGLDPLVCYSDKSVLIKDKSIELIDLSFDGSKNGLSAFLIDTQTERKTGQFMEQYLLDYENKTYAKLIQDEIIPANNKCIEYFLSGNSGDLYSQLQVLSTLQYGHFQNMILPQFQPFWQQGLASGGYVVKLCGSGGGGYLLGFTKDFTSVQKLALQKQVKLLPIMPKKGVFYTP